MTDGPFRVTVDSRAIDELMRQFEPARVEKILKGARGAGSRAASRVVKGAAPTGRGRPGQYYRAQGWGHGTLKASVKARSIRRNRRQGVLGVVIGPMGRQAFTRHWVEHGTRAHVIPPRRGARGIADVARGLYTRHPGSQGRKWLDRVAPQALNAAVVAAERVLFRYVDSGHTPSEGGS